MLKFFACLALCLLTVPAALAQEASEKIISEALKPSALERNLEQLTDTIGGRVPGTPAMQNAVAWGVAAFQAAGADSVHTEKFSIPNSWTEGSTQMRVVAPESFQLRVVSVAWAPALPPHTHVPVIDVGQGKPDDFASAALTPGAILLVHSSELKTWKDLFWEYSRAAGIIDRALQAKALAIAFQSTRPHDLLYRHTNSVHGEIDRIPMLLVAREDASRISRLLQQGQKLFADISIPNRIGGPFETANVVAEIHGAEKPGEYVILGAHLDSWELGTGALDNGCNAALVVDALRAIKAAGEKPRRSIRFILFSGEEQGLLGSWAYVKAHHSDMENIAGVVIIDSGTGKVTGFSLGGRKDLLDPAARLLAPLARFGATNLDTTMESGTDQFDFMLEGVPTFVADQDESNYLINYHATSDTFDKVDLSQLKNQVAETAYLAFALADSPQPVGPRIHRDQISQAMKETAWNRT
jgi:hypothetical protein